MPATPRKRAQPPKPHPSELIRRPDLPKQMGLGTDEKLSRRDIVDKAHIADRMISGTEFSKLSAERVFFDGVVFSHVEFCDTDFEELDLTDIRFDVCDLSNASWYKSSLNRVEMAGCRGTGVQVNEAIIRHVLFEDCTFSYAQFRATKFEHVKFVNCNLRGADFSQADLRGVAFSNCELREAEFSYSKLKGADFRTSAIDNVRASSESLQGAIVEPMQAAYLAKIMGLDVRWEGEAKA